MDGRSTGQLPPARSSSLCPLLSSVDMEDGAPHIRHRARSRSSILTPDVLGRVGARAHGLSATHGARGEWCGAVTAVRAQNGSAATAVARPTPATPRR